MNKTINFTAKGTVCESCSEIIKKQAKEIQGVEKIEFNYSTERGSVTFDESKTNIEEIFNKINEKGYTCSFNKPKNKVLGWTFGIIGSLIVLYFIFNFVDGIALPEITQNMGYGLLFLVGLLTGFHCVSMCGGFVVSYTAKHAQQGTKTYKSHLSYGLGRVISYTVIGAIFGLIGSIIAFTPTMRGVAGILAGLFLILFGLKMLNIFPVLRKIQFKTPKFITKLTGAQSPEQSSPLIIGLLNGLMLACGPLQAIYIMAAGTGSMIEGAKLLFAFALGTIPVMLGFGYLTTFVSTKATQKILKASGVIVIILGIIMFNRGLALTGTGLDANSLITSVSASGEDITGNAVITLEDGYQIIEMKVDRYGWDPDKFVLEKGIPVKWIITGEEINGCNNAIQVPKLDLYFDIKEGEQIIEFTPEEEGVISWSCWMGMIPGTFIVKEDISNVEEIQQELDSVVTPSGGSCGGGCGCGG